MAQAAHGSAPDIAGKNVANPLSLILSAAMLLAWHGRRNKTNSFEAAAAAIEKAVEACDRCQRGDVRCGWSTWHTRNRRCGGRARSFVMRCDSHIHIVGPAERYPQVAERTYLADVATLKQIESVSATRAIRRYVIVQPSFYGTDNGLLLETLNTLAGRGRGVVGY